MATSSIQTLQRAVNAAPGEILHAVSQHAITSPLDKLGFLFTLVSAGLFPWGYWIFHQIQDYYKTQETFGLMISVLNTDIRNTINTEQVRTLRAHYPDGTEVLFTETKTTSGYTLSPEVDGVMGEAFTSVTTLEELKARFAQEIFNNYKCCSKKFSTSAHPIPARAIIKTQLITACCQLIANTDIDLPENIGLINDMAQNWAGQYNNINCEKYQFHLPYYDADQLIARLCVRHSEEYIQLTCTGNSATFSFCKIRFLKKLFANQARHILNKLRNGEKVSQKELQIHGYMYKRALENFGKPDVEPIDLQVLQQTLVFSSLTLEQAQTLPALRPDEIALLMLMSGCRNATLFRAPRHIEVRAHKQLNIETTRQLIQANLIACYRCDKSSQNQPEQITVDKLHPIVRRACKVTGSYQMPTCGESTNIDGAPLSQQKIPQLLWPEYEPSKRQELAEDKSFV